MSGTVKSGLGGWLIFWAMVYVLNVPGNAWGFFSAISGVSQTFGLELLTRVVGAVTAIGLMSFALAICVLFFQRKMSTLRFAVIFHWLAMAVIAINAALAVFLSLAKADNLVSLYVLDGLMKGTFHWVGVLYWENSSRARATFVVP